MTNAVVVANLASQEFPANTVAGPIVFSLLDSSSNVVSSQSVATGATDAIAQATFPSVDPGTYTVSVQRLDGSNNALGSAVTSEAFTVAAPATVSITVAANVTVTQA